ncbi:MAG: hydrogenase iron-sulfur subunit [Desulfobacteraceae bacterium]|nr:hydrogenase iron-sulfur subunit [Desulfobacteraceae bacterium]
MRKPIAVVGTGAIASRMEAALSGKGIDVCTVQNITELAVHADGFALTAAAPNIPVPRDVSQLVAGLDVNRSNAVERYGLKPGPNVFGFSEFMSARDMDNIRKILSDRRRHVAFCVGIPEVTYPFALAEVMAQCMTMQNNAGCRTYILTRDLKVAGSGLETMYRKARTGGTVFIKFTGTLPTFEQSDDGIVIHYHDEISRMAYTLSPDLLILQDLFQPPEGNKSLGFSLETVTPEGGFLQSDNVHRLTHETLRKGVLSIGGTRGIITPDQYPTEIKSALLNLAINETEDLSPDVNVAFIDTRLCARCMTCMRTCPHHAVVFTDRMEIMSETCQGCGICAAACPALAINMSAGIEPDMNFPETSDNPNLAVFCCKKSAAKARDLARHYREDLPENLVITEIPCAGAVSRQLLLSAFENDADGVMVISCHTDNCFSEQGNLVAMAQINEVRETIAAIGLVAEQLCHYPLAANMGVAFAQRLCEFEAEIIDIRTGRYGRRKKQED